MTTSPAQPAAFCPVLGDVRACGRLGNAYRIAELAVLFVGIPLVFWLGWIPLRWVWGVLGASAVYVIVCLALDRSFDWRSLWRWRGVSAEFPRVLALWIGSCVAMAAFTWGVDKGIVPLDTNGPGRELLFGFPSRAPAFWAVVMVLYPIFSAYPQELIYRIFFFHRYERLLRGRWPTILASALAFGWMHVLFQNWIAVALSCVLGLFVGITYARSRSGAAAWIEHALYGNAAFTIGVGWFFFTGSVAASAPS